MNLSTDLKTQPKMMKRKPHSPKSSINDLRKGLFLVLKAPLENHESSEYSYYTSDDKKDPLWIVRIERYYRKKGCADLIFYRSNGENNLINMDIVLNLDTEAYKVQNICEAHVLTIYNKKNDSFVSELVDKINDDMKNF